MRFQKLKAQAFGCLKDWESPPLKPGLILVFGNNESGKTTLFNLITTLLYGWYPANRDENPHVPWGTAEAACEGQLIIEGEKFVTISRRLRSSPQGQLIHGDEVIQLRNRACPYVEVLPREVFREVYAIGLDDLKFPQHRAWECMQQLLLGGQFNSFIKPVSQVIGELEEEANRLWRPDKRGKPRARDIEEQLRGLRALLEEARAREERLHQVQMKLIECQRLLENNIAKKAELTAYIDRCERLNPVRKKLERIHELKEASAYVVNFADLPEDPAESLKNIDAQIEDLSFQKNRLEEKKRRLEEAIDAFTEQDMTILNRASEIRLLVKSYDRIKAEQRELVDLEASIRNWSEQLEQRASEILVGGWKPELEKAVDAIDMAALKAAIDLYNRIRDQYQEQLTRVEALKVRLGQRRGNMYVPWLSGAFSIAGTLGFIFSGSSAMKFVWAFATMAGIILLLVWWSFGDKAAKYDDLELEKKRLEQLRDRLGETYRQIQAFIKEVPIAHQRFEFLDSTLLVDIGRLKELLERIREGLRKKEAIVERIRQIEHRTLKLLKECRFDEKEAGGFGVFYDVQRDGRYFRVDDFSFMRNSGRGSLEANDYGGVHSDVMHGICQGVDSADGESVLEAIDLLYIALQTAEKRYQDVQNAKEQLEDLKLELARLDEMIERLNKEKEYILERLNDLPGEDINARLENLMKARELARKAGSLLEDLKKEYPDLEEIEKQIAAFTQNDEGWLFDDEMLARAKAHRDQIEQELNALNKEIGTLKKEIEIGMGQGNMDEIEGEIAVLEAELKRIARERDRLFLMRNIIMEAERRFREEHQPDVLKKAGKYLSLITNERYTRLFTQEGQQGTLFVKCGNNGELIEVKEGFLSRGTLEQVYLSLRLAFMEHLDPGGNPLPAFLDEVFVNWDGFRLDNGFALLKELAKQRQVFIFTCHDWLVERLAGKLDVQVVELQN